MSDNKCICDKEDEKGNKTCIICSVTNLVQLNEYDRHNNCPVKGHEMMLICGPCDYVCAPCKAAGWRSTAGCGGDSQLLNDKTGEEREHPRSNAVYERMEFERRRKEMELEYEEMMKK